jgi:DNA-binding MarR family transcriptional regulator
MADFQRVVPVPGPDDVRTTRPDSVRDEVDRIVAAWRRERPDLDVSPLEVFSRISRLSRHLDRDRAAAFTGHGLEPWEFDVLAALRRCGAPYQLSPGTLLAETLVTSGTMTNRIDRLQTRGLVERRRDPDDGRGVLVRLTEPGRALVDTALDSLLDRERVLLTGLDPATLTALTSALRRLVVPFDDAG